MTWISLVCLLALTSSAFSRPGGYGGGYGATLQPASRIITQMREMLPRPVLTGGYGSSQPEVIQQIEPLQKVNNYGEQSYGGQGYGAGLTSRVFLDQTPQPQQPVFLTQADQLCINQQPETVIPLEGGRKFVVCLDNGKGVEQYCPKGLAYVDSLRRCERTTGPLDACASQPCLNGGLCLKTEYSYKCQCAPGFDGENCELDARVCQTQQPCGQSPDTKCQSFRWGAALEHICVFQDGAAYGINPGQSHQSPCQGVDGPHALAYTNKGFVMCDGERSFYESCPGGTIWEDYNKACVWPDMQTVEHTSFSRAFINKGGYGQVTVEPKLISGYGQELPAPRFHEHARLISGYGQQVPTILPRISSYGAEVVAPRVIETIKPVSSYGGEVLSSRLVDTIKPVSSYGGEVLTSRAFEQIKPISSYGGEVLSSKIVDTVKPVSSYGGEVLTSRFIEPIRQVSSYGGSVILPKIMEQPKLVSSYGAELPTQRVLFEQPKLVSGYGGETIIKQSSGY